MSSSTWSFDVTVDQKTAFETFFQENLRPPNGSRSFGSSRPVSVTRGVLKRSTVGSALVAVQEEASGSDSGSSSNNELLIICGVTAQIGQPGATTPTEGALQVNWMESTTTSSRNSKDSSSSMTHWLQRILYTSNVLDWTQLSIVPGQAAWRLELSLVAIRSAVSSTAAASIHLDTALLACVAALLDTKLPSIVAQQQQEQAAMGPSGNKSSNRAVFQIDPNGPATPLKLDIPKIPVALTMIWKSSSTSDDGGTWIVDPTVTEEEFLLQKKHQSDTDAAAAAAASRMMVVVNTENDVVAIQQHGDGITNDQLVMGVQLAFQRAKQLQEQVLSSLLT